jgi:hypothetical protein
MPAGNICKKNVAVWSNSVRSGTFMVIRTGAMANPHAAGGQDPSGGRRVFAGYSGVDARNRLGNHSPMRPEQQPKSRKPAAALCRLTLPLLLCAATLTGCQLGKHSYYISPRVTGRVLAADTQQPLGKATVRRVTPQPYAGAGTLPRGGQLQMESGGVRTDAGGRFVLEGERVVAMLRSGGWHSVTVSFAHAGYRNFQTNYSAAKFKKRTPEGVPWVNAGDIRLEPDSR